MKRYFTKGAAIAAMAFMVLPGFAQEKNDKDNDKKDVQQIIITRKGNADEKTVIEIKGNAVIVDGKDVTNNANANVNVRVHKLRDVDALTGPPADMVDRNFNFNFDNDHGMTLFSEDANRAMLGVVTEEDEKGARISSISKESAAEKAGLKIGDVITKIDEEKISNTGDIAKIVRNHKPGDKAVVTILRGGKEQKLTAELDKWRGINIDKENFSFNIPEMPRMPYVFGFGGPRLGISVQDTEDGKGVKILDVDEESNAAKAGLKEDDIITHVNDEAVNSTDELTSQLRMMRSKSSFNLKIVRKGKPQTIEVKTPRKLKTANL